MAEAMRETRLPVGAPVPAGMPGRAVSGAALRWTAGPDELRLPEVVSPSTRRRDEKEKPFTYVKIGVPGFFLYHPEREPESALLGFKLCGGRGGKYEPLPTKRLPGGAIGIRSEVLGLYLCPRGPRSRLRHTSLRWHNPAAGEFLPTSIELARSKRRAEARAEALAARAAAAEAKLAELQALVEKTQRG